MISPRSRAVIQAAVLIAVLVLLFLMFPAVLAFTEAAARNLRYFWWLILLVALALWLIWGFRRKP